MNVEDNMNWECTLDVDEFEIVEEAGSITTDVNLPLDGQVSSKGIIYSKKVEVAVEIGRVLEGIQKCISWRA